jgi:hypothetical protein
MDRTNSASQNSQSRGWGWIALLLMLGGTVIFVRHLLAQDRVILLRPDGNAKWIRVHEPFDVAAKRNAANSAVFATTLNISNSSVPANIEVTALRRVVIDLDGTPIFDSGPDLSKWKRVYEIPIPPGFSAGSRRLRCTVTNENGPSLLRLKCAAIGLATDSTWQATADQQHWNPAATADQIWEPAVPETVDPRMRDMPPIVLCAVAFFAIGVVATLRTYQSSSETRASVARWFLLVAWTVLSLNNLFKVPIACGYDAQSHYEYILYLAEHFSLPKPDAGWQFFQAPLYYIVSAGFCRILIAAGLAHDTILILLRLIPLACGAMMIDISYRAARVVYPNRGDPQMIASIVGGLLPVNLYMSQTVSNEPMAAVFSGLIFLMLLRFLQQPKLIRSTKFVVLAGATLGLAWLTKINTLLWIAPVSIALASAAKRGSTSPSNERFLKPLLKAGAIIASCAVLVSGPYIIHNLRLSGRAFYIEYPVSAARWWQDPGYRTPSNFYEFGHVFCRPIYNGTASVWDSLYGTLWGKGIPSGQEPWNFRFMWCGLWLAIIPCMAILSGTVRAFFFVKDPHVRDSLRIAGLTVGCFIAAILYVYLRLPIFSCAKASYMLGTAPCLGLLAAAGLDCIPSNRWPRAIASGAIASWATIAYLTYFSVG